MKVPPLLLQEKKAINRVENKNENNFYPFVGITFYKVRQKYLNC
jgi:hypothetical protein